MFTVGVIGHLAQPLKQLMLELTPYTLTLTGMWTLYFSYQKSDKNFILWCVLTFVFTFFIEVIGVKTKLIFGDYNYGNTLGFKVLDVPLIIGFNWMFVIWGSILIAKSLSSQKYIIIIFSGLLSFVFDFFLEPVAVKLNYWSWHNNQIPIQNYLAWFIISVLSSFVFIQLRVNGISKLPAFYFVVQLIFFVLLNIFI
jgi:putative membrane protein